MLVKGASTWEARVRGSRSRSRSRPKESFRGPERSREPVKTDRTFHLFAGLTVYMRMAIHIIDRMFHQTDLKLTKSPIIVYTWGKKINVLEEITPRIY